MDLLDRMTTLVRVVDAGSLSKAARHLRLSTAAISRQLSALEAELGTQLVVRTTRQITTTDAGRVYYQRVIGILEAVEEARASLPDTRAAAGLVRISAPVTFGLARICPFLPRILKKHVGLEIDLRLEDRAVNLFSDGLDLAIDMSGGDGGAVGGLRSRGSSTSGAVVALRLGTYGRCLVASPTYLRDHPAPRRPEALADHSALLQVIAEHPARVWRFTGSGREARVAVRGPLCTNVVSALRDAALAGLGVALLPEWLVEPDLASQRLCRLLPDWSPNAITVSAHYREELRGAARLRAVVEGLRSSWRAPTDPLPEGVAAAR